jgi:hypothetical protein
VQQLTGAEAARILAAALEQPAGIELVFGALAEVPGVEYEAAQKGGFLRAGSPAQVRAGDWTFTAAARGRGIEVGHAVRGIILARSTVSPAEAAAKLGPAVLESAQRQGIEANDQAQSVIGALGEVLGL